MKNFTRMAIVFMLTFASAVFFTGNAVAQDIPDGDDIPFIDRDGDGINDLLQTGWGTRFLERYQKRQVVWEQFSADVVIGDDGKRLLDTDGDGIGDISFKDFLADKMDELIDTDGDGVGDTALKDYLGRRFQTFDRDGDGMPDDLTKEEMRELMRKMRKWRKGILDRIRNGDTPFIDEDGDGIPDNLPDWFDRRRH